MGRCRLLGLLLVVIAGGAALATSVTAQDEDLTVEVLAATVTALQTEVAELRELVQANLVSPTPAPPTADAPDQQTAAGGVIAMGDWELEVQGAETAASLDIFDHGEPRGMFVVVHLTVVNVGQEPTPFPFDDMVIATGDRKYPLAVETTRAYMISNTGRGLSEDLNPGVTYDDVSLVFDVPADATGFTLTAAIEAFTVELQV